MKNYHNPALQLNSKKGEKTLWEQGTWAIKVMIYASAIRHGILMFGENCTISSFNWEQGLSLFGFKGVIDSTARSN